MELNELIKEAGAIAKANGFHESMNIVEKMMDSEEFTEEEAMTVKRAFEVQKIALIFTELCEAIEAHRCGHEWHMREEIGDSMIRIFDFVAIHIPDIERVIEEKMEFNKTRPKRHGKLY